jgi:pyruvate dehydrogenase E1 component alpha subunit
MNTFDIYAQALRIRVIEESIAERYSEQKMRCPTHLSIGQELTPVVVSHYLTKEDKAYSTHRAHAHYLAKGGSLDKMIAELYGKESGCTGGRGGSMHLSDLEVGFIASTAIVGNSIPLAVGNALSQKLQDSSGITVSYFGDGACEEGAFYESLNFAALKSLPILFVCENNLYSVYSPLNVRQPQGRSIFKLAQAIGVDSYHANGNNLHSLKEVVELAIEKVRNGNGPVFLELETYRHREHCGPNFDDDLNYRDFTEIDNWLQKDPIKRLENELSSQTNFVVQKHSLLNTIQNEVQLAFDKAEASPFPNPASNERFIYAK